MLTMFFVKFRSFDKVEANCTYNVEATFDFVEIIVRLVAVDSVAGVDGALGKVENFERVVLKK